MSDRIGFMQGRLSALVEGRIQAFPWDAWQQEFVAAQGLDLHLMEWTLDQDRLYENPLLTAAGQAEIIALRDRHDVRIASLTGDCFMQSPFWKHAGEESRVLQDDFRAIAAACSAVGISMMVVPLVDNGSLQTRAQEDFLVGVLQENSVLLQQLKVRVIFESDFAPAELARFIARLDADHFGVNYDIGNSASLGMDPAEEMAAYGARIVNVHIKDRVRGGTTVPLGTGDADFDTVFSALGKLGYQGNYILQTARAVDEAHAAVLGRFRDMARNWISQYGA